MNNTKHTTPTDIGIENIQERVTNSVLYFQLLVCNSKTVKSDVVLNQKAQGVLQHMNEFDHYIKNSQK